MIQNHKMLVVDNELLIRDLLYDYFSGKEYTIVTANDADEAMEILDQTPDFDVVLTDIRMDGQDGLQLIDRIRESYSELPVIVMTGFPSVETAVESLRKRVFDYIIKPFNINKLYTVVEAASNEYQHDKKEHV